jgi:ribose 5-phosphate isomerase B
MIYIASDHAGVDMKLAIMSHLNDMDEEYTNLGSNEPESVDYPDYAHSLCENLSEEDIGILICGTGIGMSMAANKHPHIRCAVAVNEEMALKARQHNDANVVALGARLIDNDMARKIVDIFLTETLDDTNERHQRRIDKIPMEEYEKEYWDAPIFKFIDFIRTGLTNFRGRF